MKTATQVTETQVTETHYRKFIDLLGHGLVGGLGIQQPGQAQRIEDSRRDAEEHAAESRLDDMQREYDGP